MKEKKRTYEWICIPLILAVVVVLLSLKCTSLWPDEGLTFRLVKRSFPYFVKSFRTLSARTAQCGMIFYQFFEWCWVQVFGLSELGMRSSNILLMIPYCVFAAKTLRKLRLSPWYMTLFMFNSLLVFYINDARPYVMTMSCGMMFFYYAMLGDLNDSRVLAKMHLSFFLGMGAHMMFLFVFFAYLFRCLVLLKKRTINVGRQIKVLLCFAPLYLPLAMYYVYVFLNASELDKSIGAIVNVGQVLYFLGGFAGLGIDRSELREMHWYALNAKHFILIAGMMIAYIGMLAFIVKRCTDRKKEQQKSDVSLLALLFAAMLIALGTFFAANILFKTRFWERHCIWVMPFVLVVTCLILHKMFKSRMRWAQAAAALMIVMQLVSSGMVALSPDQAKDDYQGLVEWFDELDEDHYTILFQGQTTVFSYYGWKGVNKDGSASHMSEVSGKKVDITNWSRKNLNRCFEEFPDTYYLVLSEKERFDEHALYDLFEGDCQFQTFKIVRIEPGFSLESA